MFSVQEQQSQNNQFENMTAQDLASKKLDFQLLILVQKQEHEKIKQIYEKVKRDQKQIDDFSLVLSNKIHEAKKRLEIFKKNFGSIDFFLLQHPSLNQMLYMTITNNNNPETMTYEQLLQLGDKIGKVSKGLGQEKMRKLKVLYYEEVKNSIEEKCPVCYDDYKQSDQLIQLHCSHCFHQECLSGWLKNEKVCPLCKAEIQ